MTVTLIPCTDPGCSHRRSETVKVYIPFPAWLRGPDPIVEHSEDGQHNRTWTTAAFLRVWDAKPSR